MRPDTSEFDSNNTSNKLTNLQVIPGRKETAEPQTDPTIRIAQSQHETYRGLRWTISGRAEGEVQIASPVRFELGHAWSKIDNTYTDRWHSVEVALQSVVVVQERLRGWKCYIWVWPDWSRNCCWNSILQYSTTERLVCRKLGTPPKPLRLISRRCRTS